MPNRSLMNQTFFCIFTLLLLPVASSFIFFSVSSPVLVGVGSSSDDSPSSSSTCLNSSTDASVASSSMKWFQHQITITAPSRGCHLITSEINKAISKDISQIKMGMCNLFIQHTSASLTINENADPDVRRDMEVALNKIVPAEWNRDGTFLHTLEGDDDMPGHVKSSLMGPSLNIPIRDGRLALGTWQGIYRKLLLLTQSHCSFGDAVSNLHSCCCKS